MSHRRQTRSEIIWTHYNRAIQQKRAKINAIGQAAVESYIEHTPAAQRRLKFQTGNDAAAEEANGRKIYRWLNPDENQILPADMEPHIVNALPPEDRRACLEDLAAVYHLLAVPDFTDEDADPCAAVVLVMKECSEAIEAASKEACGETTAAIAVREAKQAIAALSGLIAALRPNKKPDLRLAK